MGRAVRTRNGRILSEAEIEKIADRMEQEDFSTWQPRVGRPSLDCHEGPGDSPRIVVRLPERLRRQAAQRAASEGRTISDVVRALLAEYVRR
jgi:hypothetical protein